MLGYRISVKGFAKLDGEGARRFGGRWNSRGRPIIYASENLSLAVLELLVHVDMDQVPNNLVRLEIEVPTKASVENYPKKVTPALHLSRTYGDRWLEEARSLVLVVPSAVVPEQSNILINPNHSQMSMLKTLSTKHFALDERLTRRSR